MKRIFPWHSTSKKTFETVRPEQGEKDFSVEQVQYFPFLIAAKNWQEKYFALISRGSSLEHDLEEQSLEPPYQLSTALHYSWSKEDHFVV